MRPTPPTFGAPPGAKGACRDHRGDADRLVGPEAVERRALDLDTVMAPQAGEPVAIAAITASELLHGVRRAATTAQRQRREAFVESLLAALRVFPFDLVTARIHASLWADLAERGAIVGAHDLLIGATAIAAGYRLATRDRRSFRRIPGLEVVIL